MTVDLATYISLGLFAALGAATWYLTLKPSDIVKSRNLAWSKYIEKMVTLELDFYERLNRLYVPIPLEDGVNVGLDVHEGVRNLATHYIEERDRLFLQRENFRDIFKSISLFKQLQIGNCFLYVAIVVMFILFHSYCLNKWWICLIVWVSPWMILFGFYIKQTRLLKKLDEE